LKIPFLLLLVSFALASSSCGSEIPGRMKEASDINPTKMEHGKMVFELESPAFRNGEDIPERYTCKGEEVSPPLSWTNPPAGTVSFALVMEDPVTSFFAVSHWVVYNIPPDKKELAEDIPHTGILEDGTVQGMNWKRENGYMGPCPIRGTRSYRLTIYALDTSLKPDPGMRKAGLQKTIKEHILAQASIVGYCTRK
jgi:Raf kinase inhibitor-like YbhB/YbcL family protein